MLRNSYLEWKAVTNQVLWEAVARDEAGKEIHVIRSRLQYNQQVFASSRNAADGKDLTYTTTKSWYSEGNVVPTANNLFRFQLHGQGQLLVLDNGEQASRERYKAQPDGSWIRRAQRQGVAIVKSTEQAGKLPTAHSAFELSSNGLLVKRRPRKTVLEPGTKSGWERAKNADTVILSTVMVAVKNVQ